MNGVEKWHMLMMGWVGSYHEEWPTMFSHWYDWQPETSASWPCASNLIIRYSSNTCIKPILYKRFTRYSPWLTWSQTHVITMFKNLLYGNDFSAWHLGQHVLFWIHINNRHLNLLCLIIICSLGQRFSRRKVRAVWRYRITSFCLRWKNIKYVRGARLICMLHVKSSDH